MYSVKLHNLVKRKLGLRDKAIKYANLSASDIDSALEEATIILIENSIHRPTLNSRVREDLRPLKQMAKPLNFEIINSEVIAKLPDDYYRLGNLWLSVKKSGCGEKRIKTNFAGDSDYRDAVEDMFWKPSFEWGSTVAETSAKGFHIAISSDMQVQKVFADYYILPVFPVHVDIEAEEDYVDMEENKQSADIQPTVIANFIWRRIVDVAVVILSKDEQDYQKYQVELNNILSLDNIYTQ